MRKYLLGLILSSLVPRENIEEESHRIPVMKLAMSECVLPLQSRILRQRHLKLELLFVLYPRQSHELHLGNNSQKLVNPSRQYHRLLATTLARNSNITTSTIRSFDPTFTVSKLPTLS